MEQLEGVQRLLELALQHQTVGLTLDTGVASLAGEAEVYLDRSRKAICTDLPILTRHDNVTITLGTNTVTASGGAGTFTFGETVTGDAGATGTFYYENGGEVVTKSATGLYATSETITGSTSSATRTTSSAGTVITSSRLVFETTNNWLKFKPAEGSSQQFGQRDGFIFRFDGGDNNTFTFTDSVKADITFLRVLSDLPEAVAVYVATHAAVAFQRFKKRGKFDESALGVTLREDKVRAMQEVGDLYAMNLLHTSEATLIKGRRSIRSFRL